MTIDADIHIVARDFGIDAELLQAVVDAEGDIVRSVQRSVPTVTTRAQALRVTARSAARAMCDWIKAGGVDRRRSFTAFWAMRWAPGGDASDPKNLNRNWASSVNRQWTPSRA